MTKKHKIGKHGTVCIVGKDKDICVECGKKVIRCLNCGKPLKEVKDKIAGKKTGHIYKCSCLPKNVGISIG